MGDRVYSPTLGRFLQVDPVSNGSANSYDYSSQDPVNSFDPSGDAQDTECRDDNTQSFEVCVTTYYQVENITAASAWVDVSKDTVVYRRLRSSPLASRVSGYMELGAFGVNKHGVLYSGTYWYRYHPPELGYTYTNRPPGWGNWLKMTLGGPFYSCARGELTTAQGSKTHQATATVCAYTPFSTGDL
jgi:hypothetical protein